MRDLIIDEKSAVYKIFHYPFHCRIPKYATYTYSQIEKYGTYSTKDEEQAVYQPVDKILTINEMTDFYRDGIVVELAKPMESDKIYNIIMDHLKMWRDYGLQFGHPYEPPMDDLYRLNELAMLIHPVATNYGESPIYEKDILDIITGLVPFNDTFDMDETGHENIMGEIQFITDKLGKYTRFDPWRI